MGKIALVDGDMIAYRCAASCEPSYRKAEEQGVPFESLEREPLEFAIGRADELLYRIVSTTEAKEHRIFISGDDNFRTNIDASYKAHRRDKPRPGWLDGVRDFLLREWGAEVAAGYEADDAIGIAARGDDYVIVSNDKDFKQIPGEHYNPVKDEFEVVDSEAAAYNFFALMLIGDTGDNVRGVDGIGPARTKKHLLGLNPQEMFHHVQRLYQDDERFHRNLMLLRILRSEEDYVDILSKIKGAEPPEVDTRSDPTEVPELNAQ